MKGIHVVLFLILHEHENVLGDAAFNETGSNAISQLKQGDSIEGIQTRMACSYDYMDWCKVGDFYYIPCKPKQCNADSKFKECVNGMCHECAINGKACSSDAGCCQQRTTTFDESPTMPYQGTICKSGTCTNCVRLNRECKFQKDKGVRQTCCPNGGQPVKCQVTLPNGKAFCTDKDPCVSGELFPVRAPGFANAVRRCDGTAAGEAEGHDYQCVNKTCARCLAHGSPCSTAPGTQEVCCDYLTCNSKNVCEFPSGCFPETFKCKRDGECCKGRECKAGTVNKVSSCRKK